MTSELAFTGCLLLGVFGWGKLVVDDLQQHQIQPLLACSMVFLFPLWNQSVFLFSLLVVSALGFASRELGGGDPWLLFGYAFSTAATGSPAIFSLVLAVLGIVLVQEVRGVQTIPVAPFLAAAWLLSWMYYLAPLLV